MSERVANFRRWLASAVETVEQPPPPGQPRSGRERMASRILSPLGLLAQRSCGRSRDGRTAIAPVEFFVDAFSGLRQQEALRQ